MKNLKTFESFGMYRDKCDRCGESTNGSTTMSIFNEDVICMSDSGKTSIEAGRWHFPHPANELIWSDNPQIGKIAEYKIVSPEKMLKINNLGKSKNGSTYNKRNSERARYKF
jgi:hypothetical protein